MPVFAGPIRVWDLGVCDNSYMSVAEVLSGAGMGVVVRGAPLPLVPAGSVPVGDAVAVIDGDEGGAVFVFGAPVWCWDHGDVVGRRVAAVQLVETSTAQAKAVAAAFGVDELTLRRWRLGWRRGGVAALAPAKRGPKGPSRLTEAKVAEIRQVRAEGASMAAVAARTGVSLNSVSRALRAMSGPVGEAVPAVPEGDDALVVLARPEARSAERDAARRGELVEAEPRICATGPGDAGGQDAVPSRLGRHPASPPSPVGSWCFSRVHSCALTCGNMSISGFRCANQSSSVASSCVFMRVGGRQREPVPGGDCSAAAGVAVPAGLRTGAAGTCRPGPVDPACAR